MMAAATGCAQSCTAQQPREQAGTRDIGWDDVLGVASTGKRQPKRGDIGWDDVLDAASSTMTGKRQARRRQGRVVGWWTGHG